MVNNARIRFAAWRNHVLADAGFQRAATRFPFLRPVARRRARALFDLVAGFTYSQTVVACVETGLLDLLATSPMTTADVADRTALPQAGAERLLRAAAAIGLVESIGTKWLPAPLGAALRGNRGIADMVAHHRLLYADLADPVALLRRGGGGGMLARHWTYADAARSGAVDDVAAYSTLMTRSQPLLAQQILDAYSFGRHHRLLDVGGGEGTFLIAAGSRTPALDLALFDLPAVGDRARSCLTAAGLASRATVFGGDFHTDPLPPGYDLITLVRVLHDHDDTPALALLRAIHAALPPGGCLLIAEPMADTGGAEPAGDAYFGLYLLAMGSGRPRRRSDITAMLYASGFRSAKIVATAIPLVTSVIVAR